MSSYTDYSDDFYINMNLSTEMDLPTSRETLLHFFEQVQKRYPGLRNFYSRERAEYVLEEEKEQGSYRWTSLEPRRISAGQVNPTSVTEAFEIHKTVMEIVPYALSVSSLDCESLNVMFGFDYTFRGNHNHLIAEALGLPPAFERMQEMSPKAMLNYEPQIQFALDDDCRYQCRLSIETRTNAYHVKMGEYPEDQLSVYLTARRYGALDAGETFVDALEKLNQSSLNLVDNYLIENVLVPLQQTIAIQ
jgi:hypothetical protein